MIDSTANSTLFGPYLPQDSAPAGRKVLRMVGNDRMAGSVPSWVDGPGTPDLADSSQNSFRIALAGESAAGLPDGSPDQSFGFFDLLDMVNPLQHIPVVSQIYREITGDSIKPVSKVIGGGVFGGPAGAAGGLVNVIVEEETGRDLAGNALALVVNGEKPRYRSQQEGTPEQRLESVMTAELQAYQDLPVELLAFSAPPTAAPAKKTAMLHNDNSRYNS